MGSQKQDHSLAGLVRQVVDWPMQTLMYVITYIQEFLYGIYTGLTWDKRKMRDLSGWTMLVMGASDGVGFESAKAFAEHNAHVILHGRDDAKTQKAAAEIKKTAPRAKLDVMIADLTSFKSVKAFAEEYKRRGYPLHVLLNNAGIQSPKGYRHRKTEDGFEITYQTNHFALVYTTLLLLDKLKEAAKTGPTARVVWVTSIGSQIVNPPIIGARDKGGWGVSFVPWHDLKGQHNKESDWWAYSTTKLFNIMTAKELARRLDGTGVKSYVAHPGIAVTDHFGKSDSEHKLSSSLVEIWANSIFGSTTSKGAIPLEYACTAPELEGKSGAYIGSPELGPLVNQIQARTQTPNAPMANNPTATERLWKETVKIISDSTHEDLTNKV